MVIKTLSGLRRNVAVLVSILVVCLLAACTMAVPQTAPAANVDETTPPATEAAPTETAPEEATPEAQAEVAVSITAHPWQWTAYSGPMEQFDVETPENYIIVFADNGGVTIKADCNRASGSYTADGSALTLETGPMTRAMCPPDSRSDQFVRLLGAAAIYFFDGDNLLVDLFADGGTLTFAPAPADSLDAQSPSAADLAAVLGNLTYNGVLPDQPITLADGVGAYTEDGPGTPFVRLVDHLIPSGDLNGDGAEDAAAILVDNTTGSADFVYLVAVLDVYGEPTPTDALQLGDRTPVKSMTIDGGEITIDLIAPGPGDAACCPTWNARKTVIVVDTQLVASGSEELSQVTLVDLAGTMWQLVSLGEGQPALLADSEITLAIEDGQISGSAGCNTYTGNISGDEALPQVMTPGPLAVTAMMCDEPITNLETTYLNALVGVSAWRYDFGFLALNYRQGDGALLELTFAPVP